MLRSKIGKTFRPLVLGLAIASLVAACSGDPTPTNTPQPTSVPTSVPTPLPTEAPAPTATPDTSFEAQWAQLIEDAKAEGEIVIILGGTDSRIDRDVLRFFADKYEINLIASTGSGTSNTNRVLAERGRGRYTVDVSKVGTSSQERMLEANAFTPVEPLIIHPDILDRSGWHFPKIYFTDRAGEYSMAYNVSIDNIAEISYNTDLVSQEEVDAITSFWDLLEPDFVEKWRGQTVMREMSAVGGANTTRGRMWSILGQDYLERVTRETGIEFVCADCDAEMVDGLAAGKWAWSFFGAALAVDQAAEIGLPVANLTSQKTMDEGLTAEIGGEVAVMADAPHPAAAQLFINWYYSKEGQDVNTRLTLDPDPDPSLRKDIPQNKVSDERFALVSQIPQLQEEGRIEVIEFTEEWLDLIEESRTYMDGLYQELGLPW